MGMLINGQWETTTPLTTNDEQGRFIRPDTQFRSWITEDGCSGYKAEPERYHLYVSYACPWACRTLIMRSLKGLENIISVSIVEPLMLENGWEFGSKEQGTVDTVNHANYLYEIYLKADINYTGKVTVPLLWDKYTKTIVNNESAEIMRMLNSEFNAYARNTYDFYPKVLHKQINELNEFIYKNINNGVYQCGFAKTQMVYDEAVERLFSALDTLEERLSQSRYLFGDILTETDWRLFTTLIRFDVVYVTHFKCNLKRIEDYSYLPSYLRNLYQIPGIKQTVNFFHIKEHYYRSQKILNPSGIIPKGPIIDFARPRDIAKNRIA